MSCAIYLYDAILSYSSKDKPVVRAAAERLKSDGLKVWFDEWKIQPTEEDAALNEPKMSGPQISL